jgi:hypothetical protein
MMMSRSIALLLMLGLAGCDAIDPYSRAGAWHPNGANDADLRAMVAVPSDLALATPASPADGTLAAAALTRLRRDQVRPLLNSGLAQIVVSGAPPGMAPVAPPSGTSQ